MSLANIDLEILDEALHCEGCGKKVQSDLENLPGVAEASADHKTQRVSLKLDLDQTPLSRVKEVLAAAGYETK